MKKLKLPAAGFLQHTSVSVIDQMVLSGTNFLVNVILIRNAPASEYGLFVLAQAVVLLGIGLQNAVVNTPMSVLAPKKSGAAQRRFIGTLATTQYLVWLPFAGLVLLSHFYFRAVGAAPSAGGIAAVLALALPLVFLREFCRRAFFICTHPVRVLGIDLVFALCFLAGVLWISSRSPHPAALALLALGIASAAAGVLGALWSRRLFTWRFRLDLAPLREAWRHGRWALLGVLVTWAHAQGFLYLLATLKTEVEVHDVSAAQKLLMPIAILLTSLMAILVPRGAGWLRQGARQKLIKTVAGLGLLAGLFAVLYTIFIASFHEQIVSFLFNKRIAGVGTLVWLWGGVLFLQIFRSLASALFQIFEKFAMLFAIGLVAAAVSLTTSVLAITLWGAAGSLLGLAAGEAAYLLAMGVAYLHRRTAFQPAAAGADAAANAAPMPEIAPGRQRG